MAGILPAVAGGIFPPGWKPDDTAAKMAAATGTRRFMAPMRVQTWRSKLTLSLDVLPAAWAPWVATGPMTNSFRLFPAFTRKEPKRFYRGREL